ncbi:SDR family NAD(P)-dependent oxidoreductase [Achromobacter veterisilvae]|uniref:3-oxoacyl-[acyl-carrier-protein] reductase FabG n=1 Tax=Achromobacter veterisilvae TaxID=2069367 RepID=A0A446CQG1_9BURK|nr:SDR family NAD(P)-dependent oxidoreductase [Achromobacter veterisilvae]SSW70107.1 3-oxoacyl-[acyl-carrier-protein] reductase FabG [Achromobacter veterisilvae]
MSAKPRDGFAGQVALVTGGAGGIGGAVAGALAGLGARVVAADARRPDTLPPAADVDWLALDVASRDSVRDVFAETLRRHGRLDVLVNAAGVVSFGAAADLDEAEWDRVQSINLKGSFLCCQAAIAAMRRAGYGRIVNLGSIVGKNGGNARPWLHPDEQRVAGNIAYGVSKAGVHAMTAFLAKELASAGITVNAVAPGPIATRMTTAFPEPLRAAIPVGRMGAMDDVVNAVLFLAGREAGFITGEVLDVNGGMWCD